MGNQTGLKIEDIKLKIQQLRSSLVKTSDFEAIQELETTLLSEYIETLETTNKQALDNQRRPQPNLSTHIQR